MPISEVFNEDCMIGMSRYPDKFFDLAIVDPPYGINISDELHKRGESNSKNGYRKYAKKEWDRTTPDGQYFYELMRISKHQIIWGGELLFRLFGKYEVLFSLGQGAEEFFFCRCGIGVDFLPYLSTVFRLLTRQDAIRELWEVSPDHEAC